jgi:hypothetical protein
LKLTDDRPPPEQRVAMLYAWVAIYPNGSEGIISGIVPTIGATPLISSQSRSALRLESAARRCQDLSAQRGEPIRIELRAFQAIGPLAGQTGV